MTESVILYIALISSFILTTISTLDSFNNQKSKISRFSFDLGIVTLMAIIPFYMHSLTAEAEAKCDYVKIIQQYEETLDREQKIIIKYKELSKIGMINRYINQVSKEVGLDPRLVKAFVFVESGYNTNAVGKQGEIGLMQIKLATARAIDPKITKRALQEWHNNIYYGCIYLKLQIAEHGLRKGILAYNGGGGILLKKKNGKYANENYYKSIMNIYKRIQK